MKAILMSIKPEWLAKILNGEKTVEIRKTKPNCELQIDVYLYCTKEKYGLCFSKDPEDVWWSRYKDKDRVWCVHGGKVRQWLKRREVNGKVVAKFTLEKIETLEFRKEIPNGKLDENRHLYIDGFVTCEPFYNGKISTVKNSCLSQKQLLEYGNLKKLYAWHISNLQTFETPKELEQFISSGRPPQSWQYIEVQDV